MLKKNLNEVTFAFLDVETTGLSARSGGRVCEVAICKRRGQEQLGDFQFLINPGCAIPAEVTGIHGITDAMVADCPGFGKIAAKLLDFIDGTVLVCHNAGFDMGFIEHELRLAGFRLPESLFVLDTLKAARKYGGFKSNKLGEIAREIGLSCDGWHRALADVKMTEKIFFYFLDKFSREGAGRFEDILALQFSHRAGAKHEKK